jgi:hypothetical protein
MAAMLVAILGARMCAKATHSVTDAVLLIAVITGCPLTNPTMVKITKVFMDHSFLLGRYQTALSLSIRQQLHILDAWYALGVFISACAQRRTYPL